MFSEVIPVPATTLTDRGSDLPALLKRLEEGVRETMSSAGWRRFLSTQAKFHRYSPGNVLLILDQRPNATRVAGYQTWHDMGRFVRKGEHGIAILAPMIIRVSKDRDGEDERPVTRFRVSHVFDITQTEGQPLPEPPILTLTGDSPEARRLLGRLTQLAVSEGVHIQHQDPDRMHGAKGFYLRTDHTIVLAKDLAADQQAKTLIHELAHHFLGHGQGDDNPRHVEEAEAESTAFVVCSHFGIDTSEYSFGYLADWTKDDGGPALVKQVAATVHKTSSRIINALELEPAQVKTYQAPGRNVPDQRGPERQSRLR